MLDIALPFIGAFFNRLGGAGLHRWWSGKVMLPLYYFLCVFAATGLWGSSLIVAIGMFLYRMPGWGDYWDGTARVNKEVAVIDFLVQRMLRLPAGFYADFISMSLRGLCAVPMFLGLYCAGHTSSAYFVALGGIQGVVYFGARKLFSPIKMSEYAEPTMGFLLLGAVSVILH